MDSGDQPKPDSSMLLQLAEMKMPYGKYKGSLFCAIPVYYLEWMKRNGFPKSKLGSQLETMYEIKLNGLEYLLDPLKK